MKYNIFTASKIALPLILLSSQSQIVLAKNNVKDSVKISNAGGLELSITANRKPQAIDKTLASVSVVTREEIDKVQAQDIIDVLRLQHGISISRNGGAGSPTSIFIRGSESDHVLVLLDGVRVSSATTGAFDWSQIQLDQIERIEIVRGSRAALYGSDAIGGVIEITSRKNTLPYASITAGKYGTYKGSAGFSKNDGKNHVSANISLEESDSFSATNKKAGQFTFNADKDPYKKSSVGLSFSRQLTDRTKAGIEIFQSKNKVDYDQGESDGELQTVNATLLFDPSDHWSQKFSLSHVKDELESKSSFGISNFSTHRKALNWQNNIKISDATSLILGLDYRQDKGKSKDYDEEINNKAIYANIHNKRGALNLDASLRFDKHSQAGDKTTGQVAAGYDLSKSTTAYASYGTAFKAPNINELYYPGFFGSYAGNVTLKPETSKTFEIGLKSQLTKNQRLEVSLFQTKVKNLISFTGDKNQAVNAEKVTLKGFEAGYSGQFNKLDWALDLSLLETKDKKTGKSLLRRPDSKVTLNLGYAITERTRIGLDASLVSKRDGMDFSAFPAKRVKLKDYTLLNLSVNHKVTKHIGVGMRLENVTDDNYELAYGYNTPKRGAYLTLSYK